MSGSIGWGTSGGVDPQMKESLMFSKFNPDEAISPYRTNAKALVRSTTPINWGPAQRTGKVALVLTPWLLPLLALHWIGAAVIGMMGVHSIIALGSMAFMWPNPSPEVSRINLVIKYAWWPLSLVVFGSQMILFSLQRAKRYILTGA